MARAARIALDLALVSLRNIRPAVAKLWDVTKSAIKNTAAKPIVENTVVCKVESSVGRLTELLTVKLEALRNRQLPGEIKYLEQELEKVRRKMGNDGTSSKTIKTKGATVWQYAKTEMVPPMTLTLFHGSLGKKIEDTASKVANTLIDGLQKKIKDMDAEDQRKIKEKEDAIKAAFEKQKAEVKKMAEEKAKQEAILRDQKEEKAAAEAKKTKDKEPPKEEKKNAPVAKNDKKTK